MIYAFEEKHGTRYIQGDTAEAICKRVLLGRLADGWYENYGQEKAEKALDDSMCAPFLRSRKGYEYEGFHEIFVEKVM
jgi:hypothetical protein